ncbi:pyrimidine reductase family protein [Thermocrispum agreste]|uniref:Pyrimidine reductase family protein n=1 Tax=Thermocrispum agreste TaxID=37925 RepID=A0ABD6FET1_9PSEU|nr:pyrimidine reductase family protein [Thermocrispum agreste]
MGIVYALWPTDGEPTAVTDADLERLYDYPPELTEPWVQANMVSSADGAAAVDGRSAGLSHPADKRVFALGRDLADVVLVGAGTAQAERYAGIKPRELRTSRRQARGLSPLPPIAVVTNRCSLSPQSPLLTDTMVPPIVLTCAAAPAERRDGLADAGADVVVVGEDSVDLPSAVRALGDRGLYRIDCEGGPRLLGAMVAADLVDQLCLTVSPLLAGAGAERIVSGPAMTGPPRSLRLASVLTADGFLMLRYRRA